MLARLPWLVKGLMPERHRILIVAYPAGLKTLVVNGLGVSVAAGVNFLGLPVTQGPVIIVDEDTPTNGLYLHLERFALGIGFSSWKQLPITVHSMEGFRFDNKKKVEEMADEVRKVQPRLVIFDCLSAMVGSSSENDAAFGNKVSDAQKEIMSGCPFTTVVSNHHARKNRFDKTIQQIADTNVAEISRGSGQIIATCDTAFVFSMLQEHPRTLVAAIPKARRQVLDVHKPFCIELVEGRYGEGWARLEIVKMPPTEPDKAVKDIFALFYQDKLTIDTQEILKNIARRYSERRVRASLDELESNKAIVKGVGGHNRYTYHLNPNHTTEVDSDYWDSLTK